MGVVVVVVVLRCVHCTDGVVRSQGIREEFSRGLGLMHLMLAVLISVWLGIVLSALYSHLLLFCLLLNFDHSCLILYVQSGPKTHF